MPSLNADAARQVGHWVRELDSASAYRRTNAYGELGGLIAENLECACDLSASGSTRGCPHSTAFISATCTPRAGWDILSELKRLRKQAATPQVRSRAGRLLEDAGELYGQAAAEACVAAGASYPAKCPDAMCPEEFWRNDKCSTLNALGGAKSVTCDSAVECRKQHPNPPATPRGRNPRPPGGSGFTWSHKQAPCVPPQVGRGEFELEWVKVGKTKSEATSGNSRALRMFYAVRRRVTCSSDCKAPEWVGDGPVQRSSLQFDAASNRWVYILTYAQMYLCRPTAWGVRKYRPFFKGYLEIERERSQASDQETSRIVTGAGWPPHEVTPFDSGHGNAFDSIASTGHEKSTGMVTSAEPPAVRPQDIEQGMRPHSLADARHRQLRGGAEAADAQLDVLDFGPSRGSDLPHHGRGDDSWMRGQ